MSDVTTVGAIAGTLAAIIFELLKWLTQLRLEKSQIAASDAGANSAMADATESLTNSTATMAKTMQELLALSQIAKKAADEGRSSAEEKIQKLEREFNEFKRFCDSEKASHDKTVREFKALIEAYAQLKTKFDELEKRNMALELVNRELRETLDSLQSQINGTKPLQQ
jgi:chromosome segregation ATPase